MEIYVADTVALARYFEDRLPRAADEAFAKAENLQAEILVPEIVVGEFVYLAFRGRLKADDPVSLVRDLLGEISASTYLRQASMTSDAWDAFITSSCSELHDRMIHSIAVAAEARAILTPDPEIKDTGFRTIW